MRKKLLIILMVVAVLGTSLLTACNVGDSEKELADKAAASAVVTLIEAIPSGYADLALESDAILTAKAAVETASSGYDKLTDDQKEHVAAEKLAILTAAKAWLADTDWGIRDDVIAALAVDALIAELPTTYPAWTDALTQKVYAAESAYEALSAGAKTYIENLSALENAVAGADAYVEREALKIYDVYILDSESGEYEKVKSYASIITAVDYIIANGNTLDNDSAPYSGDYIVDNRNGQTVFRRTGGSAAGNNNTHHKFTNNEYQGAFGWTATLYNEIRDLDTDTVLFHSGTGARYSAKAYRGVEKTGKSTNVQFEYRDKGVYFGQMQSWTAFTKLQQVWQLSGAKIVAPDEAADSKMHLYFGANSWSHDFQVGVYMDLETGDWRFFEGSAITYNASPIKNTQYIYYNEAEDDVITTSTRNMDGSWTVADDIRIDFEIYTSDEEVSTLKLNVTNRTTETVYTREFATGYNMKPNVQSRMSWGIMFPQSSPNKSEGWNADAGYSHRVASNIYNAGRVENLVLSGAWAAVNGDFAGNGHSVLPTQQVDATWVTPGVTFQNAEGSKNECTFNYNYEYTHTNADEIEDKVTKIEDLASGVADVEANGVALTATGTAQVDLSKYFNVTGLTTVSYAAVSATTANATVAIAEGVLTVTGVAAGTSVITVYVVQNNLLQGTLKFTATVS